ncbi:hypothetical protein TNCT_558151 [Trichonephila clavata]|uniref:Uncharacterized protein n=1 Tax=Trichonephila clavata TaxID=2740835 RepID=A0A8X6LKP3_TRICU|nr:hypothetical protein TNCT_558151 [Trichonephila clavata]
MVQSRRIRSKPMAAGISPDRSRRSRFHAILGIVSIGVLSERDCIKCYCVSQFGRMILLSAFGTSFYDFRVTLPHDKGVLFAGIWDSTPLSRSELFWSRIPSHPGNVPIGAHICRSLGK